MYSLPTWNELAFHSSWKGLQMFFILVGGITAFHWTTLFLDRHAWSHRLAGAFHFFWLAFGSSTIDRQRSSTVAFAYDIVLGCSGLLTTVTAARDFPHRYVRNAPGQSGTLSEKAMVTQAEMMEHSFYQFLNLWQVLYLNAIRFVLDDAATNFRNESVTLALRFSLLWLVTAPWCVRDRFPVHSFRRNWQQTPSAKCTVSETLMYRIKKAQYLVYKHVILHGLNLTVGLSTNRPINSFLTTPCWRIFWLCLNTAYVMEFFLQSLVKRKVLSQASMLTLNRMLMVVSTIAAMQSVIGMVCLELCAVSLLLNLVNRHQDVINTLGIGIAFVLLTNQT
ncbi:predicted protein [Phaeodactylum tricornutum CCAP 1055/1]|uniref:Uncharacterized protein n=1 Tax=Phaeodactylum tricornutum (strain CCAP 1055/1) TaxID=556484 RepID=B5Y5L5_PHATC|nr:predicted protein [Phaeodactylum tricornutum CCAP 1055/1]ACI65959.1 predicted protein [Phaeodactylum tricornutum CCAP 1055/1]|eukprot:XP_002186489.1 predicted protein [Phaeodactylum tricornutum CCAP 1055/1]